MVPFFSDCSGKSGKSGKAVFRHFSQTARAKPEKVGKWCLPPHPLPRMASRKKYPFSAFSAFFPACCKKCRNLPRVSLPSSGSTSRVPRNYSTCTDRGSGIPTAMPRTLRAVSAAPKKVPSTAAKTAPSHPLRVAKFRAETTPDAPTAPRLLHQ